jgi:hypothetical protein
MEPLKILKKFARIQSTMSLTNGSEEELSLIHQFFYFYHTQYFSVPSRLIQTLSYDRQNITRFARARNLSSIRKNAYYLHAKTIRLICKWGVKMYFENNGNQMECQQSNKEIPVDKDSVSNDGNFLKPKLTYINHYFNTLQEKTLEINPRKMFGGWKFIEE